MKEIADMFLRALRTYIDKQFDYEFARQQEGADGYFESAITERKNMEEAWSQVEAAFLVLIDSIE